jgi:GDP-D-glucose phosphorylase
MAEFNYKSFSAAAANAQDLQCSLPDQTTLAFDEYARIHWDKALSDGIFRYKLDDTTTRSLDGQYGFVVQNNPKRFTHRRTPHEMASISEPFSPDKFHFNKIKQNEVRLTSP